MSRVFAARYAGVCANCDEHFPVDEPIRYEGSDVVHDTCPDAQPTRPERPACPNCWLVHAGECDR